MSSISPQVQWVMSSISPQVRLGLNLVRVWQFGSVTTLFEPNPNQIWGLILDITPTDVPELTVP